MYHCLWNRLRRLDVRNDFYQAEAVIRPAAGWEWWCWVGVGWVRGGEQMAKYSSMSSFPTTRDGASRQIPKMKRSVMNKS